MITLSACVSRASKGFIRIQNLFECEAVSNQKLGVESA